MAGGNLFRKASQRMQHVSQSLPRRRLGKKDDKIGRMAFMQRHADFRIVFESANSRPVPGAWIDHDDGRLGEIDTILPAIFTHFADTQQRIICRMLELAGIEDGFIFEVKQRRQAGPLMFQHVVSALAHCIPEQNGPLPVVQLVIENLSGSDAGIRARF